jgi:hypothetical protein
MHSHMCQLAKQRCHPSEKRSYLHCNTAKLPPCWANLFLCLELVESK